MGVGGVGRRDGQESTRVSEAELARAISIVCSGEDDRGGERVADVDVCEISKFARFCASGDGGKDGYLGQQEARSASHTLSDPVSSTPNIEARSSPSEPISSTPNLNVGVQKGKSGARVRISD